MEGRLRIHLIKKIFWPYAENKGNWDWVFTQILDGIFLMHTRFCNFIALKGINYDGDQSLGMLPPGMLESVKRQTGYVVLESKDNGETWTDPIKVNISPIASLSLSPHTCGGSGAGYNIKLPNGGLLIPLDWGILPKWEVGLKNETARCFLLRLDNDGDNWKY